MIKNKDYSKWIKLALIILGISFSVMKWFGIMGNATIDEIWKVIGFAYGVGLGTMDINIVRDSWTEKKEKAEACEVEK